MISLETFKNLMNAIIEQEKFDDKLTDLLVCKDCTGWIKTAENLVDTVFKSLEVELNDEYECLSWWLYDICDGDKYVYYGEEGLKYNLNELDDLYYYIIGEHDKVKKELYVPEEKTSEFSRVDMDEFLDMAKEVWGKS